MQKNNSSGVNGVTRYPKDPKKDKITSESPRWIASWRENGKPKQKRFGIFTYGEEGAKRRAIAARKEADKRTGCKNGIRPKV